MNRRRGLDYLLLLPSPPDAAIDPSEDEGVSITAAAMLHGLFGRDAATVAALFDALIEPR